MHSAAFHRCAAISRWLPCYPLGSGAFGHVFLSRDLDNGLLFAAKTASSSSPAALASLLNELRILKSLRCPFIVELLGFQSSGSYPILFLEYMNKGSLFDAFKLSGGRFQQENRVRCFTGSILRGLSYLHENGIVHCDIKSQNILIGSSGVKIADFGSARRLGDPFQDDGNFRGTPLWMAPEVAQGKEPMYSADIWSLGCTVVEMLQGRPPWGHVGSQAAALFKVGCAEEDPPLPEYISAEAKDFLSKCLQRDPSLRWAAADLLKHPFVCGQDEEEKDVFYDRDQPSPRSILAFVNSECSESENEDELLTEVARTPHSSTILAVVAAELGSREKIERREALQASNWIVVKTTDGWCEGRQLPFMERAGETLPVKVGEEVSFAAAEFLSRKRAGNGVG